MPTIYLTPSDPLPTERHIAVVVHRDKIGGEKGYFYDSADGDDGGSGPFDWRKDEAIHRAEQFGRDRDVLLVVVLAKRR